MYLTHTRGDTLRRSFRLDGDWVGSDFAEVKFTLRRQLPVSTATDAGTVQVTKTGGGITFDVDDPALGYVVVAASALDQLATGDYHYDLQATVSGSPQQVYTLDSGKLKLVPDVTRVP